MTWWSRRFKSISPWRAWGDFAPLESTTNDPGLDLERFQYLAKRRWTEQSQSINWFGSSLYGWSSKLKQPFAFSLEGSSDKNPALDANVLVSEFDSASQSIIGTDNNGTVEVDVDFSAQASGGVVTTQLWKDPGTNSFGDVSNAFAPQDTFQSILPKLEGTSSNTSSLELEIPSTPKTDALLQPLGGELKSIVPEDSTNDLFAPDFRLSLLSDVTSLFKRAAELLKVSFFSQDSQQFDQSLNMQFTSFDFCMRFF